MRGCNLYGDDREEPQHETSVISFDLAGGPASMVTTLTGAHHLYASATSLYVTRPERKDRLGAHPSLRGAAEGTPIDAFALAGAEARYAGTALVAGQVLDQFAMDEHDGRLRVATMARHGEVVSVTLSVIGKGSGSPAIEGWIGGIAPTEQIRAVRFAGDRAYVVTFRQVDPLFVLDLSGGQPKRLGELHVPGFATYIHPVDDRHLLTIGLDTNEANGAVRTGGVRLQIVDVEAPLQPKLLHLEILPEQHSEALHEHLAFTYLGPPRNLLVLPVGAHIGAPSTFVVYEAAVAGGFRLLGRPAPADHAVERTLVMDDHVVAVSRTVVEAWTLNDLGKSVASVRLAR
jgi:uncharacterized secreted protein with C-terminal beta-propeller domain